MTLIQQLDTETLEMMWQSNETDLDLLVEIESELYHRSYEIENADPIFKRS